MAVAFSDDWGLSRRIRRTWEGWLKRIMLVFGTRPEAIKMLPVARALRQESEVQVTVCVTGQHRQMLYQVLKLFDTEPDYDLNVMTENQGLEQITANILEGVARVIDESRPDRVLVQGDTATAMAASLAAFYRKVPVGHVEAGLRSGDVCQPWPEEANRRIISLLADLHFAPTIRAQENLLAEGTPRQSICVTGNTIIDALRIADDRLSHDKVLKTEIASRFSFLDPRKPILLVTAHRRENFGTPFENMCEAIRDLAALGIAQVVFPVHMNPNVRAPVLSLLGNSPGVHLIEPLEYLSFVHLLRRSYVILTDSGGIQEEGPSLGKPVFVMRNVTERPEALATGTVRLIGTDRRNIFSAISHILTEPGEYKKMSRAHSPYGDGHAAKRITDALLGRTVSEFDAQI